MKKQIILGMTSFMFAGMLNTETVSAIDSPVPVSFDNHNTVTDPDDPLAEWSVSIPIAIEFKKDKKSIDIPLELIGINGSELKDLKSTLSIDIKAKSEKSLLLTEPEGETMAYEVIYGDKSLTGNTELTVATLTKDTAIQAGVAKIAEGVRPTKVAKYTDSLTYTIIKMHD